MYRILSTRKIGLVGTNWKYMNISILANSGLNSMFREEKKGRKILKFPIRKKGTEKVSKAAKTVMR